MRTETPKPQDSWQILKPTSGRQKLCIIQFNYRTQVKKVYIWFPAVSKDQEKEFFEHEKTSCIRPAHFLLASCLPAHNHDKMTTGDGQTDCLRDVYWHIWHMWHLHFSDNIQIHSLKLTSHPPKRGLPKQRSSLPLLVFRCYVVCFREVANHHPRRSPSLTWKLGKLHSTFGWNLECCLPWVSWLWFQSNPEPIYTMIVEKWS